MVWPSVYGISDADDGDTVSARIIYSDRNALISGFITENSGGDYAFYKQYYVKLTRGWNIIKTATIAGNRSFTEKAEGKCVVTFTFYF
jgi:hypothetical protein